MALTSEDIQAISSLTRDVVREEMQSFDRRFDHVYTQLDFLTKANEKREEEYLVLSEQMTRLESKFDTLETKVDGNTAMLKDHTGRLDRMEATLSEHTATLGGHTARLERIEGKLDHTVARVQVLEEKVA